MYSSVAVRSTGADATGETLNGHLYDVSLGGARLELDEPLAPGARVSIEVELPGCPKPIAAEARVVRVFDAIDDPGPRRICVAFESFAKGAREMLARHIDQGWLRPAPAFAGSDAERPIDLAAILQSARTRANRSRTAAATA